MTPLESCCCNAPEPLAPKMAQVGKPVEKGSSPGDGPPVFPSLAQPFVNGWVETPCGRAPRVESGLTASDRLGGALVRLAWQRDRYTVEPGLYALGAPGPMSPVLVTANYKLSFDTLRSALVRLSAWILVLDTKGVNVWCAAGKGTFGTDELAARVRQCGLGRIVDHRRLILPQLGAPGVAAYKVKKLCGFEAVYGPVRARDIPAYLAAGLKAGPDMRRVVFSIGERAKLVPVEAVLALKWWAALLPLVLLQGGFLHPAGFWQGVADRGVMAACALLLAIAAGAVITPLFLPWLPGRAFSVKGIIPGMAAGGAVLWGWGGHTGESLGWALTALALAAFLSLNFTGASTYTCLSGVKKEMRWAMPAIIAVGVLGLAAAAWSRIVA